MYFLPLLVAPLFLFFVLIAIFAVIFWLWMLIDCLQREFKDKLLWVLVIIFVWILGAILYYFLVKSKKIKKRKKKR